MVYVTFYMSPEGLVLKHYLYFLTPSLCSSSPEGPVLKHCQYIFQDLVDMAMCCGPVFVGRSVRQDLLL